jgi:hypothetical protein
MEQIARKRPQIVLIVCLESQLSRDTQENCNFKRSRPRAKHSLQSPNGCPHLARLPIVLASGPLSGTLPPLAKSARGPTGGPRIPIVVPNCRRVRQRCPAGSTGLCLMDSFKDRRGSAFHLRRQYVRLAASLEIMPLTKPHCAAALLPSFRGSTGRGLFRRSMEAGKKRFC